MLSFAEQEQAYGNLRPELLLAANKPKVCYRLLSLRLSRRSECSLRLLSEAEQPEKPEFRSGKFRFARREASTCLVSEAAKLLL